jgi:crotonobetainyl-CoA:carnitine CoA-transferase CaiB-like acyl-CoA transferase
MFKLLEGVRVIECAMLFNGGAVGMHLGDLGADVIKIESPGKGDYLRDFLGQIVPHVSPAHAQTNKNKRSVELDVHTEAGRALFFELIKTADIFVDGFRAGACDEMGIGYEAQRRVKPDIVYVQHTGYGAEGPYAAIPTHGQQMNALAGGMPCEVGADGFVHFARGRQFMGGTEQSGAGPAVGAPVAALAAVSALVQRRNTGEGAYIDVSAADAVLAMSWIGGAYAFNKHRLTSRVGLSDEASADQVGGGSARYQLYETKDQGFILFCGIEPKFWRNFCRAVGREDLAGTIKADGPVDFGHNEDALRHDLSEIFRTRTQAEWTEIAAKHDIAMGPAPRLEDVANDPHIASRGVIVDGLHPTAGTITYLGFPAIISGQRYGAVRHAPLLGEHTAEVLAEFGVDRTRLDELSAAGVVGKIGAAS